MNILRFENSEHLVFMSLDRFLNQSSVPLFLCNRGGNSSFGKLLVTLRWKSLGHCTANRGAGVNLFTLIPYKKEIKFMKAKLP